MFERYNEDARRTLFYARYEASQLGSKSIEPEHLLLGLLHLQANPASPFLAQVPDVKNAVLQRTRIKGAISKSVEIPFTAPTKRALQVAAEESSRLGHAHIGPEHLFLGLLADPATVAGELLVRNGLQLEAVRNEIAQPPAVGRDD
jgi:ATP-dependent Clp protease ATP-binding subunit ClpC